jgi:hypothetical protein
MSEARRRELARIRSMLERLHSPRLQMSLIVALTASVGFLASVTLLYSGVGAMWLRYPLAVLCAYAAFLFFLWCWLRLRWEDFVEVPDFGGGGISIPDRLGLNAPWSGGGGHFGGGGASGSFDQSSVLSSFAGDGASDAIPGADIAEAAGSALDAEELTVVLIAIAALIGAVVAAAWIVWAAPALFAELTLDAALATGLYRRLRAIDGDYWLRTAIRKTVWAFTGVAVLFTLAGAAMQMYAPQAKSIGQVMRQMKDN